MANLQSFRELKVWQKSHALVLLTYRITKNLPSEEKFGLQSQMRRAAISVAANIVEGFRRTSPRDSLRFYDIANASLEELRYETQVASDLSYIPRTDYLLAAEALEEVSKMLNAWIRSQIKNSRRA